MAYIALELIRNKKGRVVDVFAINFGKIKRTKDRKGYVQVIKGKPVAILDNSDVVIAKVR